jgi:hypothetical protein
MTSFDRDAATRLIARTDLELPNRAVAEHWLSLWRADGLPPRGRLKPERLRQHLPTILLLDTVPGKSVTVRLAGTTFRRVLGTELTGVDWSAMAPEPYQVERLQIISRIAEGGIGIGHRRVPMRGDGDYVCEEILLPFAAEGDLPPLVMVHVNWRPEYLSVVESGEQAMGAPIDFKVLPLA